MSNRYYHPSYAGAQKICAIGGRPATDPFHSPVKGGDNLVASLVMNDQETNRVVEYGTASTSYGRETVADILKTGLGELSDLAVQSTRQLERGALLEYVSQWTIKRTGQPEPLVREVLGCAGRWLDEVYEEVSKRHPESLGLPPPDDEEGAEPV